MKTKMLASFFENLRYQAFWSLDFLKGSPVRNHYIDIKRIFENYDNYTRETKLKEYLSSLLNHASSTTSYYSKFKDKPLEEFPVIDKNIIRENSSNFLSSKFRKKQLYKSSTSGSTGTPFVIFQDKNKRFRNSADNIYYYKRNGFIVGNRVYYLRIWNEINKLSTIKKVSQNVIPIDIKNLTREITLDLLEKLKDDNSSKVMTAYASTYDIIVDFLPENYQGEIKLNAIFAMSEYLSESTRLKLIDFFKCPVLSRYGNSENGILGDQYSNNNRFYHINNASYLIEFLDLNSNQPVKDGEQGRVVVTDLFNYAMPFIRYDTGDVAIKREILHNEVSKPVYESIEGRKLDFITSTENKLLSPHIIDYTLRKYADIKQFQFIQEDHRRYHLKLIANKNLELEKDILSDLRVALGESAQIRLEYIDEIPLLDSGKRKMVVNLMN